MKPVSFLAFLTLIMISFSGCEKDPAPPEISGLNPSTGGYGTEVIITGKNFAADATGNTVTINGIEVEVVSARETSLTIIIPVLAEGEWPVKVKTKIGETAAGTLMKEFITVCPRNCYSTCTFRVLLKREG